MMQELCNLECILVALKSNFIDCFSKRNAVSVVLTMEGGGDTQALTLHTRNLVKLSLHNIYSSNFTLKPVDNKRSIHRGCLLALTSILAVSAIKTYMRKAKKTIH